MADKPKVKMTPTPQGECGRERTRGERTGRFWVPGVLAAGLCLACLGGDRQVMPEVRANNGGVTATPSARSRFPLAGQVKLDGHAPDGKGDLIVMLEGPRLGKLEECCAICKADGTFKFDGGHSAGQFVVHIAQLVRRRGVPWAEWTGPDQLKNLYNDPDKNARRAEFVIRHQAPGKTDYVFNLKVAGVPPVKPGPNAGSDAFCYKRHHYPNALIRLEFE